MLINRTAFSINKFYYPSFYYLALTLFLITFSIFPGYSQPLSNKWCLALDGYNDVYFSDLVIDNKGNTYAAINYTSALTIPGLNKKLPVPGHVHGLIMKIDPNGKPLWAHALKSDFDNRIKQITLAPNGDILFTGFGDGLLHFPGLKDTLKAGIARQQNEFNRNPHQGFYAARYSPLGERKWVEYWNCNWGEGLGIAANEKDEVFMTYYNNAPIEKNGKVIDDFIQNNEFVSKISLVKFDKTGKINKFKTLGFEKSSMAILNHKIQFDKQGNMLLYGIFRGKLQLTPTDSLTNDSYLEGMDSYLAKYQPDGKLLWSKKIGGQNYQLLQDIVIAPDNSIYGTGRYSYECLWGNGINVLQKSKFEYKSGESMFYFHLMEDGELDFIRYEKNTGYNSSITGESIALDKKENTYIIGNFNDTLKMEGLEVNSMHYNQVGLLSSWQHQKLTSLNKVADVPNSYLIGQKIRIQQNYFSAGGDYAGNNNSILVNGQKQILPNKDFGMNCYLIGGELMDEKEALPPITLKDSVRNQHITAFKPLLACVNDTHQPINNYWFPVNDTTTKLNATLSPCGEEIKGMEASLFPNPTTNVINIKIAGITGSIQLNIYSASGQLILSNQLQEIEKETILTFDVSQLSTGTYYVTLRGNKYVKALPFVKGN